MSSQRFVRNAARLLDGLFVRKGGQLCCEAAKDLLFHFRMQLRVKFPPVYVVAGDHERFELSALGSGFKQSRRSLEVATDLIFNVAFYMAGIVAGVSIAAAVAGNRI